MAMQAQKLFHGPPRRRRRGGLAGQAYFTDALQLLRVTVKATGEGAEALARWEDEAQRRDGEGGEEIEPSLLAEAGGDSTPEGSTLPEESTDAARRRRGGRRRRRRGKGGGGAPQAAPSATPGAP